MGWASVFHQCTDGESACLIARGKLLCVGRAKILLKPEKNRSAAKQLVPGWEARGIISFSNQAKPKTML